MNEKQLLKELKELNIDLKKFKPLDQIKPTGLIYNDYHINHRLTKLLKDST